MPTTAPQIEFHVQGLEPLAARLRQMGTRGQITLNELLRNILGVLVPIVRQLTPRRKGKLANSTVGQIIQRAGEQLLEIRQAARTPEGDFYGVYVREGTKWLFYGNQQCPVGSPEGRFGALFGSQAGQQGF